MKGTGLSVLFPLFLYLTIIVGCDNGMKIIAIGINIPHSASHLSTVKYSAQD